MPPDRSCPAGTPQQCRRLAGCRLLDRVRTEQLARIFGNPAMDCGWGLRGLGAKEAGHNPIGHRSGAVRVHETAVAVAGLTAAGYEEEANSHCAEPRRAAEAFGYRLPEMYAGEQRTEGGAPLPHPAATAAAAGILLLTTLAGLRPAPRPGLSPSARCAPHPSVTSA